MYGCNKVKCLCGSVFTAQLGSMAAGWENDSPKIPRHLLWEISRQGQGGPTPAKHAWGPVPIPCQE